MKLLNRYANAAEGNVAVIFGIVLVPLIIGIGISIDSSRLLSAHKNLQNAADTAALAAAVANLEDGQRKMKRKAREILRDNASLNSGLTITNISVNKTNHNTVKVVSKATIKPMFPQIFGYPKLEMIASSEANLGTTKSLEIAIAFDSTSSMNFDSRWDTAMASVNATLRGMKDVSGSEKFHLTLVPFSDRVNIGTANSDWLDGPAPAGWEGCVEPREEVSGSFAWAVDDDEPRAEPFTATVPGAPSFWGTYSCASVPITGPTRRINEITRAINSMTPSGTGRLDSGMAWAWRALSPKWRAEWNTTDYPQDDRRAVRKKIIYISDGNTELYTYAMSRESTWGHNLGSIVAFEHLVELCRKAKDDGVEIYMLQLEGNPNADDYFRQCASSEQHYYALTDATEMTVTFGDILDELQEDLRIVH